MTADWLEAVDDAHALREAAERADSHAYEVWDRNRLVERAPAERR